MELPYDADSFNIITNVESANYYVDYEAFVRGLNKTLKVNGLFLCADTGDQNRVDYINEIYPQYGFEVKKHINITDNVAVACAIEKYRMMKHSQILADVMMYDEERYFLYRRNPNIRKDDYHIFVIEKKETL
jgi:ubiquinone/menaquinone biosynthesis C-methylase UbiE